MQGTSDLTPEAASALQAALNNVKPEQKTRGAIADPAMMELIQRINMALSPTPMAMLAGLGIQGMGMPQPQPMMAQPAMPPQAANPLAALLGGM